MNKGGYMSNEKDDNKKEKYSCNDVPKVGFKELKNSYSEVPKAIFKKGGYNPPPPESNRPTPPPPPAPPPPKYLDKK